MSLGKENRTFCSLCHILLLNCIFLPINCWTDYPKLLKNYQLFHLVLVLKKCNILLLLLRKEARCKFMKEVHVQRSIWYCCDNWGKKKKERKIMIVVVVVAAAILGAIMRNRDDNTGSSSSSRNTCSCSRIHRGSDSCDKSNTISSSTSSCCSKL